MANQLNKSLPIWKKLSNKIIIKYKIKKQIQRISTVT